MSNCLTFVECFPAELLFPSWITLAPLLKISWSHRVGLFLNSTCFHCMALFIPYYAIFITKITLSVNLEIHLVCPLTFFFSQIFLANLYKFCDQIVNFQWEFGLYWFYISWGKFKMLNLLMHEHAIPSHFSV